MHACILRTPCCVDVDRLWKNIKSLLILHTYFVCLLAWLLLLVFLFSLQLLLMTMIFGSPDVFSEGPRRKASVWVVAE